MEKLHHKLWLTDAVNAIFGPLAAAILRALGLTVPEHDVIPDYLAMVLLVLAVFTVVAFLVRSRLSVENPGRLQIVIEDIVGFFQGSLRDIVGPQGPRYLTLVAGLFLFLLVSNLAGMVPGLMAPTSNLNVTVGCALTVWVYYHLEGVRAQGLVAYVKHFALPPGSPVFIAPLMFVIEIISHLSRVMSLSLRLFGNIFGEELVILILASIVPFVVPLPMMFLGLVTSTLQAFIFVMLTMIYLGGAVAVEHAEGGPAHH